MKTITNKAFAIWFTGLSGAGKSTLSLALKERLTRDGCLCKILDGDELRRGLNNDLSFSTEDRKENIRRAAEINKLFLESSIMTINAFITPTEEIRQIARSILKDQIFEIYLSTPLGVCQERDPKGYYKKIARGELKCFTGVDAKFEESSFANLTLDNSQKTVEECVDIIYDRLFEIHILHDENSRSADSFSREIFFSAKTK